MSRGGRISALPEMLIENAGGPLDNPSLLQRVCLSQKKIILILIWHFSICKLGLNVEIY